MYIAKLLPFSLNDSLLHISNESNVNDFWPLMLLVISTEMNCVCNNVSMQNKEDYKRGEKTLCHYYCHSQCHLIHFNKYNANGKYIEGNGKINRRNHKCFIASKACVFVGKTALWKLYGEIAKQVFLV